MRPRSVWRFAIALIFTALAAESAFAYESIPRDSPLGKHLAEIASRTGMPLELMLGPHAWKPAPVVRDSVERARRRAAAVARLQARMNTASKSVSTSGMPPITFAEPPTLDSLPPLPTGPKLPDSLTAGMNSFVAGDLDGDGLPDFIGVESADSVLDVRFNLGGGVYAPAVKYALATDAYEVVLGDFNGDGHPDLAITNYADWFAHQFSVLLNLGDGTLGARFDGNIPSLSTTIIAIDLDHDGRDDLVFGPYSFSCVYVEHSQPGGAFGPAMTLQPISPIDVFHATAVAAGDVDGDGNPDIVLVYGDGECYEGPCQTLALFYGRGDGSFEEPIKYQAFDGASGQDAMGVEVRDIDGDHQPDLVVSEGPYETFPEPPPRSYRLIRNAGRRQLEAPSVRQVFTGPWILFAARTSAGAPEDILVSNDKVTTILRNRGDGTFSEEAPFANGSLLDVLDLNGDGLSDVVTADSTGIQIRLSSGSGGFHDPISVTAGRFLAIADFTGHHHNDLAVVLPNYHIGVLPGDASGGFGAPIDFGSLGVGAYAWRAVDLDGDGLADFASVGMFWSDDTNDTSDSLFVSWNTGSGFTQPSVFDFGKAYVEQNLWAYPMDLEVGDFNGDGLPDLALVNGDGESGQDGFVRAIPNLGHRVFGCPSVGLYAGEDPYAGVVADLDGDGLDDLVVSETTTDDTGRFTVYHGVSGGTLAEVPGPSNWGDYAVRRYAFGIAAGDFNGDGRVDVAIGCGCPYLGTMSVLAVPNITNIVHPTPALASLISADPSPDGVSLIWDVGASAAQATIQRRSDTSDWIDLATLYPDGSGRVSYVDRTSTPGARLDYRLRIAMGTRVTTSTDTWVNVPLALILAIDAPRPNPTPGPLAISFTVPSRGHAALEVLDVSGRRVRHREIDAAAASRQFVSFASEGALSPGLYFVRLTQDRRSVTSRVAVVR